MDVSGLQRNVLFLELSTLQGSELHLDVSALQRSVLLLEVSTTGPELYLDMSALQRLCCSWRCLPQRPEMNLDVSALQRYVIRRDQCIDAKLIFFLSNSDSPYQRYGESFFKLEYIHEFERNGSNSNVRNPCRTDLCKNVGKTGSLPCPFNIKVFASLRK